jgi:hypothetical protein
MANSSKRRIRTKFSIVIGCILAVLFIAVPCRAVVVYSGETVNIGTGYEDDQVDSLVVFGTVNLYPGAYVVTTIQAFSGCTINFYGWQKDSSGEIIVFNFGTAPNITVHGSNFAVNDQPCDPLATSFTLVPSRYSTLTGFYGNGDDINLRFFNNSSSITEVNLVTLASGMAIDIKPGNEENNINLNSNGVVPVAALTTEQFDAATIDPATARFAGAAPAQWSLEDVDGDGDNDVIFHFKTQELNLTEESTEATLTAQLADAPLTSQMTMMSAVKASGGAVVSGTDTVKIVGAKKSKK